MGEDRVYKCLNPVGIQWPVDLHPLAPRLEGTDGKNICLSVCGEPDIAIPLENKLKSDYPRINWRIKKTYGISPVELSDEELKTTAAIIQGVAW